MARYTGPVCRLCRREGTKLFLKGDRCTSGKCALDRRSTAPGQHGAANKKMREYGLQMREKQKTRRYYGVLERQFVNYYEEAARKEGMTGENLICLLERRLDNVVYRLGFGTSRPHSRQLVRHGHIYVNGKRVNIPSFLVSVNDVISVREKSADTEYFKNMRQGTGKVVPKWLTVDAENLKGVVAAMPAREDIDLTIEEHLIVERYSR